MFKVSPSDPVFFQNPYPFYDRMRALGPAFYWENYGHWCFPHYEHVNSLLRNRQFGRENPTPESVPNHLKPFYDLEANSMLELEPPRHTRLRTLVHRAFVSRNVDTLRPRLVDLCMKLIENFGDQGSIDLLPAYAEPIPVTIIAELLGVPTEMAPQLLDWSHKMVAMYEFSRSEEAENAAVKASLEFGGYIRSYIEKRRKSPKDDLISQLIAAEEAGDKLTTDELVTTCILLLNAGHEATVHAIGNSVKALLENEIDVSKAFCTEKSTALAVEELLRFDTPLHMFTRFAMEDVEAYGIRLKKGDTIGLMLGAANHDPDKFTSPNQLNLSRQEGANLSFSAGIHFCVGAPLARLELLVALPVLFKCLPNLTLVKSPVYTDRYHFRGLKELLVLGTAKNRNHVPSSNSD